MVGGAFSNWRVRVWPFCKVNTRACSQTSLPALGRLEATLPDGYREYSFLWKPEAKALNESKTVLVICKVREGAGKSWAAKRMPLGCRQ